ncbi:unnamed protein product [Protopolystoma xenopodis]|uniref:Uncharacterized protein n=1 Tax=Protopolystoma xenopodis TaxID=117903 RepID=A0A3S4ZM95_9PLAT|nr:unnamed protein product [Protopolystoma xenopodis]
MYYSDCLADINANRIAYVYTGPRLSTDETLTRDGVPGYRFIAHDVIVLKIQPPTSGVGSQLSQNQIQETKEPVVSLKGDSSRKSSSGRTASIPLYNLSVQLAVSVNLRHVTTFNQARLCLIQPRMRSNVLCPQTSEKYQGIIVREGGFVVIDSGLLNRENFFAYLKAMTQKKVDPE